MNLLIFFAIPFATILLAIVLEKILDNPILVAITFFGIYLIIAFALFAFEVITDLATALIAIIIYTIIAFITAYIVRLIKCICDRFFDGCKCGFCSNNSANDDNIVQPINNNPVLGVSDTNNSNNNGNLLRISCRCNNGNSQELLSVNSNCPNSDDNDNNCGCSGNNNNNQNNRNFINRKYYTKFS